jgi:hypothetical protein
MNAPLSVQNDRQIILIILFTATLFGSASLMFVLQPMFGKALLPLLGGSPAVWNTCMVFYQTILFFGYLYAHYLSTSQPQHRQILIHAAVILISCIALPLALPENIQPPTQNNPTFWILWTLLLTIGLPFFVVSTTGPLIQKWFSHIGHHTSQDPYYLYAASNAGSLLALLSYPFIIEPNIGLSEQKVIWSAGYIILGLLISGCATLLWRHQKKLDPSQETPETTTELTLNTKLHWLVLAFVPSSLLLGLTNFISTDIASVPLLWIIPLTLYLLSFIIVFSKWGQKIHGSMLAIQPIVLLPFIAYSFINPAVLPFWVDLTLHLTAFFLAVMVCHGELAKTRPHTNHLTTYYLIMSFAGMLGGMFNTFIAPFIFNSVYEYPIMIILALLLRPNLTSKSENTYRQLGLQTIFPVALLFGGLALFLITDNLGPYIDTIGASLILLVGLTYAFRSKPVTLSLLTAVIIFFTLGLHSLLTTTLHQKRTFFGVLSVRESTLIDEQNRPEKYHEFFHGTTKHGAQRLVAGQQQAPLTYYSRPGPIGQLFKTYELESQEWVIGAVGLGAGALACYSRPNQAWSFYEIDPTVVEIAKNPSYFKYLYLCGKNIQMHIGDARLSLLKEPDNKFDLLIMDAFSSDSVPTHLLTQEALELYFSKLKPTGILAFHITNRHLSLKKILADHARQLKYSALIQEFKPQKNIPLVIATDWVVLAKKGERLALLQKSRAGNWEQLPLYFDMKPWTDDFTNILSIWK